MMRILHRWPGLVLAILLLVTSLSGVALSVFPALESARAPGAGAELTVAELATRVQARHSGLEQIKRSPSGQFTAWWFDGEQPGSAIVDPVTGGDIASADPDPARRWLTTLHRSLFMGDAGRLVAIAGALGMLILAISGALLVARRTGGWRRWFARLRGPLAGRLHTEIARVAVVGLVVSSLSALWMSAETFEILSIESANARVPAQVSGLKRLSPSDISALQVIPVADLRELSFPAEDDPEDVYTVTTRQGMGYVDSGSGLMLSWQDSGFWQHVSEFIYMIHTGQGAAVIGLLLGLMALGVPVMAVTGVFIWTAGRRSRPQLKGNAAASQADTVILVGSEGGTTWGFAAALAKALRVAGQTTHVAAMSSFKPSSYRNVQRFFVLASTYGDGDAPASAAGFLERFQGVLVSPNVSLTVLGFGDSSFPAFCAFARRVDDMARANGWAALVPFDTINRQSSQDFARWGRLLGESLGTALELEYQPVAPATQELTLIDRHDYGEAVQVPMAILRFALPKVSLWQRMTGQGFPGFQAGDLLGVLPEGSATPRLYSLASGSSDGFLEVVVRKHPGGLASGQLHQLETGQTIRGFLRHNPGFHAGADRTPLILIGAGTGVGPLIGFIRANQRHRPIQLFFGLRSPESDFLYQEALSRWTVEGHLQTLHLAVSRAAQPRYVQDVLRQQAPAVTEAIHAGAKIMVCGGREMARGVQDALTAILAPTGLTLAQLKAKERYVEDVY